MDFNEFDDLLIDYLYEEIPEENRSAVEARLQSDPAARERLEDYKLIREGFGALEPVEPPPQTYYNIMREARQSLSPTEPSRQPWYAVLQRLFRSPALAMLTMLCLVVATGVLILTRTDFLSEADRFQKQERESLSQPLDEAERPPQVKRDLKITETQARDKKRSKKPIVAPTIVRDPGPESPPLPSPKVLPVKRPVVAKKVRRRGKMKDLRLKQPTRKPSPVVELDSLSRVKTKTSVETSPDQRLREGLLLYKSRKYGPAIPLLTAGLKSSDRRKRVETRFKLAESHRQTGNLKQAVPHYRSVVKLAGPYRHRAMYQLAQVYLRLDQPEKARVLLNKLARVPEFRQRAGRLLSGVTRKPRSKKAKRKTKSKPSNSNAY